MVMHVCPSSTPSHSVSSMNPILAYSPFATAFPVWTSRKTILLGTPAFDFDYVQRRLDQLRPYSRSSAHWGATHIPTSRYRSISSRATASPMRGMSGNTPVIGRSNAWVKDRQRSEPLFMAILSRVGASTPGGERGTPIGVDALAPLLLCVLRRLSNVEENASGLVFSAERRI